MTNAELVAAIVEDLREPSLMMSDQSVTQNVSGNPFEAFALDKMAVLLRMTSNRIEKKYGGDGKA